MSTYPGASLRRLALALLAVVPFVLSVGLTTAMALSSVEDLWDILLGQSFTTEVGEFEVLAVPWCISGAWGLWGLCSQALHWVRRVQVGRGAVLRTLAAIVVHIAMTAYLLPEAPVLTAVSLVGLAFGGFLTYRQLKNKDQFRWSDIPGDDTFKARRISVVLAALVCIPSALVTLAFGVTMAMDIGEDALTNSLIAAGWLLTNTVVFVLLLKATRVWRRGGTPALWQSVTAALLAGAVLEVAFPESLVVVPPALWAVFLVGWTLHEKFRKAS